MSLVALDPGPNTRTPERVSPPERTYVTAVTNWRARGGLHDRNASGVRTSMTKTLVGS